MTTRAREPIDELKQEIQQIVGDVNLEVDQKIRRIFELRKPAEVSKEDIKQKGLNFWLNNNLWTVLKRDRAFWLEIIKELGFVEVEAENNIGNKIFGFPEIAQILGDAMANEIIQAATGRQLAQLTQQADAKDKFINYMLYYDEEASLNYLVLYGRFLALQDQLVPIEQTIKHKSAACIVETPSLILKQEFTFHVVSRLSLVVKDTSYPFFFYQKKATMDVECGPAQPFIIQQGSNLHKEISVNGPILSVLKFFYPKPRVITGCSRYDTVFLVLNGPLDDKLLSFNHLNIQDVLVIDEFVMQATDFDDLVYASDSEPTRFATNLKGNNGADGLKMVDLSQFSRMTKQPIRRLNTITSAEKRKLAEQREKSVEKGSEGYLEIQTEYDYGKLFVRLAEPLSVRFRINEPSYQVSQVELLCAKLIRLPSEKSENICHLAALVRRYTNNNGAFTLQLRIYRYQRAADTDQYISFTSHTFKLVNFMSVNGDLFNEGVREKNLFSYGVKEMNLIFHTDNIFYIEIMESKKFLEMNEEYTFVNSQLIEFDFLYASQTPTNESADLPLIMGEGIKDFALFEEIRVNHFKIYDYRHDKTPLGLTKYDCIFYKYYINKANGRIIFYKENIADALANPGVAEKRVDDLKPNHIVSFTTIPKGLSLAFLTFKTEEIREREGAYRMMLIEVPLIARLSLVDQLRPYTPDTFSLSASKLSISDTTPIFKCSFCGLPPNVEDLKTNKLYCDGLCQRLLNCTYRL